jgi:hypothetical protein
MIDVKLPYSNRNSSSSLTTDYRHDIYDTINQNFNRALNEIAAFQPQYLQSLSNLQLDYIQTIKNMIQNTISAQKQIVDISGNSSCGWNIAPPSVPAQYIEQLTRRLSEFTNNLIRVSNLNSQLTITIIDTIRENMNIYNRASDELSKYNTNMAKAWNSFFATEH